MEEELTALAGPSGKVVLVISSSIHSSDAGALMTQAHQLEETAEEHGCDAKRKRELVDQQIRTLDGKLTSIRCQITAESDAILIP